MEVKTVIEAKRQCESEIRAIINMFERQSGCTVQGINMEHRERFGMEPEIANIYLDVRVDVGR